MKSIFKSKCRLGLTLVEVVITILVLAIVSLGAINFQLYAVQRTILANQKMAAARIGSVVLENWKSTGGSDSFDPMGLDLGILKPHNNELYQLTIDDVPYYFTFSSRDIDTNDVTGVMLRELSVSVRWRPNRKQGTPGNSDPRSVFYTYVRREQSGG